MSNSFVCGEPQRRVHGKMGTTFQLPLPMTPPPRKHKNKRNPGDGAVWGQGGGDESVSLGSELKTFADERNTLWGICGTWSCVWLPPVPENNVWGNPEPAGTGLWKWLPLLGHSRQSLYSPPPLGQSGDRDKITRVLQSRQKTCSLTCDPNKYTWKGKKNYSSSYNPNVIPLPRRNTWSAPVQHLWWLREHFCTPVR